MTGLRLLVVDDDEDDAKLVARALETADRAVRWERVDAASSLAAALVREHWDVVVLDWVMPGLDALAALAIVRSPEGARKTPIDVPVVVVSGAVGEEVAVSAIRAGANDFVLKPSRARLAAVVARELRDVEERRAQQRDDLERRAREATFRVMIERVEDAFIIADALGVMRYASPSVRELLGYEPEELIGHTTRILRFDDDQTGWESRRQEALSRPNLSARLIRFRKKDGGEWWAMSKVTNLVDDPAVAGFVIHLRDRTDVLKAEAELRASEARYRRIVETTNEGVVIVDLAGRVTFTNYRFANLVGQPPHEIVGRAWSSLLDVADGDAAADLAALTVDGRASQVEAALRHSSGERVWTLADVVRKTDEAGQGYGYLVMLIDTTERRRVEDARRAAEEALAQSVERMRHAQKMEAIGRLAGGVAHDFNNMLMVILSYGSVLADSFDPSDERATDTAELLAAARRAAELTRQLLVFSRQQVVEPRVIVLDDAIRGIQRMCQRILGEDIALVVRLGVGASVRIDPGKLEQVMMNLLVNARDAMPDGGQLVVESSTADLAPQAAAKVGVPPGPYLRVRVKDSGHGMDRDTLSRIFEPFFTTKPYGKGTGLGLSTVFGIVQQAGGGITVDSAPGAGATFDVYLPRVDAAPSPTATRPGLARPGVERVLLIEDEPSVRAVTAMLLRRAGYQVVEAVGADEALAAVGDARTPIDLVVSDVVMPGVNGFELARRVRAARPGLRIVFMSGYAGFSDDRALLEAGMVILTKPVAPDVLLATVRASLDGAAAAGGATRG